jgi:Na+-driven multidrug efflux pump
MIIFAGRVLLRVLYGASFARFEPAAEFLAVGFFITTFGLGPILILKATKQTRWLLIAQGTMLVVAIPAVAAFAFVWGVTGAAAGIALASLAGLVALLVYARAARRLVERGGGEADGVELVGDFPA